MDTRLTSSLLFASGLLLLAACPGSLENPERFLAGTGGGGTCPDIEADLFPNRCGTAGCHNATDQAAELDLVSPGVASRLVGVAGTDSCDNTVLLDPNDVPNSLMVTKLQPNPSCGNIMPLIGTPLSDEETACLVAYLEGLQGGTPTTTTTSSGGGMGGAGTTTTTTGGGMGGAGGN